MELARKKVSLRLVASPPARADDKPRAPLDDGAFIARVCAGDAEALDTFYRRYAQAVWRMLVHILGDDPELEDVHHDVFVQAIRSVHRFRQLSTLQAWLYGIAVNCARSALRSRRRRRRWLAFVAPEELPEPGSEPDTPAAERVRAVYALLEHLPPDERIVFSLCYWQGMTLGEMGEVCGVSLGTVKRRLRRARQRFQKLAVRDPELRMFCREEASP